jgi:hypothetical protein
MAGRHRRPGRGQSAGRARSRGRTRGQQPSGPTRTSTGRNRRGLDHPVGGVPDHSAQRRRTDGDHFPATANSNARTRRYTVLRDLRRVRRRGPAGPPARLEAVRRRDAPRCRQRRGWLTAGSGRRAPVVSQCAAPCAALQRRAAGTASAPRGAVGHPRVGVGPAGLHRGPAPPPAGKVRRDDVAVAAPACADARPLTSTPVRGPRAPRLTSARTRGRAGCAGRPAARSGRADATSVRRRTSSAAEGTVVGNGGPDSEAARPEREDRTSG